MSRRVSASMSPLLRFSPLVSLLTLGACASVLGIEDISSGPAPGAAGDGTGNSSSGGDTSGGGKSGGGGKTGTPEGGSEPGAGEGPINGSGSGNVPIGGEGGGGNTPQDPTVRGKLIDFWGHVLPNVAVQIGDTLTSSDENGEFVVEEVPNTYDVSFHVEFDQYATHRSFGWVFQGLTRRDPTLQVSWGLPVRSGNVVVTPQNVTISENQSISVAIGGEDGNTNLSDVGANGVETSASWEGGDTSSATAHGLYFQFDPDTDFPTSYLAYDSTLVSLADSSEESQITLDLTAGTLDAGNLQGTVTTPTGTARENHVFLRFDTGATIPLLADYDGPNTFSYLVPSIPKSSITVAASEGEDPYWGSAYAIAHANGLAATDDPAIVIPTPASLTSPADELTGVDGTTNFAFQSAASNPGPFVVVFDNVDTTGLYQTLYVVTASKQLRIPQVVDGGFTLQKNKRFTWRVTTHGNFSSVDAMAGPAGFIDPFFVEGEPVGANTEDGHYTISTRRFFVTAP